MKEMGVWLPSAAVIFIHTIISNLCVSKCARNYGQCVREGADRRVMYASTYILLR